MSVVSPLTVSTEMYSVRAGEVMLKGKASGNYIAMSSTGSTYITVSAERRICNRAVFKLSVGKPKPQSYLICI